MIVSVFVSSHVKRSGSVVSLLLLLLVGIVAVAVLLCCLVASRCCYSIIGGDGFWVYMYTFLPSGCSSLLHLLHPFSSRAL